jgi:hypothetical protein
MITRMVDGLTVNLENEVSGQVVDWLMRRFDDVKKELDALKTEPSRIQFFDKQLDGDAVRVLIAQKDAEISALKDTLAHRPGSAAKDDPDPRQAYGDRIARESGGIPSFHTPQQEAAHWDARSKALLDSGKVTIVTGDKDPRLAWMDSQSGKSILTRRQRAV